MSNSVESQNKMSFGLFKKVQGMISIDRFTSNPNRLKAIFPDHELGLNSKKLNAAYEEISAWPNYERTSLRLLKELSQFCGVKKVLYKDESSRLGLGSFKALGGAYAVKKVANDYGRQGKRVENLVVTTASAGNHGRSVAWGAREAGCRAKIYVHSGVSKGRADAMAQFGAEIIRINGNYDQALAECIKVAKDNSWELVSDTSWNGYETVPIDIMAGYGVLMRETLEQMANERPTHFFLPAGCGGLAAGLISYLWKDMGKNLCKLISVESTNSSCVLNSIEQQSPFFVDIKDETIMVGLSCGEVSQQAWKVLSKTLSHSVSISDNVVAPLMKMFADGKCGGGRIEAGECSTSGAASLIAISKDLGMREQIGLNQESVVLILGTEGATDSQAYNYLLEQGSKIV